VTKARGRSRNDEQGFTIIDVTVALALLAIVASSLAGVFWTAIRTAGVADARTAGASLASREIESIRAVSYDTIGFYTDQTGYATTFEGFNTVTLGATTPVGSPSLTQPLTPDPNAKASFNPDPDPTNAQPIVIDNVSYSVKRYIVWTNAQDASTTYTEAYKRMTVIVSWTDRAGAHSVRQDSIVYPGGEGKYAGPEGVAGSTTTTSIPFSSPDAPTLASPIDMGDPAGQTQVGLAWTAASGGAAVTSYSIVYSTDPTFPSGSITVIAGLASNVTSYTVSNLSANTAYYFEIIAYAGSNASPPSNVQTATTRPPSSANCTLGGLSVTGATFKSTTGTILQKNGRMSENLTLAWTTTGTCTHAYQVNAVNNSGNTDPLSPYALTANGSGAYSATVLANGQKGWSTGVHTFTVYDVTNASGTNVVKTFKVCVNGSAAC
jgi:type II secretory pathway pseudopilin PulG